MVAGSDFLSAGYSNNYGSLTPNTYNGIKITYFKSSSLSPNTSIKFESINRIPETLKIKINGTTYDFIKTTTTNEDTGNVSISWKYKGRIFKKEETYTIEFLN